MRAQLKWMLTRSIVCLFVYLLERRQPITINLVLISPMIELQKHYIFHMSVQYITMNFIK